MMTVLYFIHFFRNRGTYAPGQGTAFGSFVGSLITAICNCCKFLPLIYHVYNLYALSTAQPGARGRGRFLIFMTVPRTGSIKPSLQCILLFVCSAIIIDPYIPFSFTLTTALSVQCGGCRKSPRTRKQCCYTFRSIVIVEHIFHI